MTDDARLEVEFIGQQSMIFMQDKNICVGVYTIFTRSTLQDLCNFTMML